MTESPSNTCNHQRIEEMHVHLTPVGAVIPYSVCFDSSDALWVAAKGGLFKFLNGETRPTVEKRNPFRKSRDPQSQACKRYACKSAPSISACDAYTRAPTLLHRRTAFSAKKMAPYCRVLPFQDKVSARSGGCT